MNLDISWNKEDYFNNIFKLTLEVLAIEIYEEIVNLFDFYFDEKVDLVVAYNIDGLIKDQKDQILLILKKNSDLFARDISEL
ncbi:7300_t:CDS:1, partial [Scutellospora calospora]